MSGLRGRPTAAELVGAVADFLDTDVREATRPDGPADPGQVHFHARVAANALRMVVRELESTDTRALTAALAALGAADEADLAAAIRRGELDERGEDVTACLRVPVSHRLAASSTSCRHRHRWRISRDAGVHRHRGRRRWPDYPHRRVFRPGDMAALM